MSWEDCIGNENVVKISPNEFKAESLIETAKGRMEFTRKPDEKNANYVFEDYYTSLLEIIHALAIKQGFKIKNHLCIGFYIRDFLKERRLFNLFDDVRYKRNSLVYYGKRMDFETCMDVIGKCKELIKWVLEELK